MPNSYYGDRLKKFKPERVDVFHVPYGDFLTVTGSGIGCSFGDKVLNLYTTNLYFSGHHQPATGFFDWGSGAASPHGTYRGQWADENQLLSGNSAEFYYYNNKLFYTGSSTDYTAGTLKFKSKYWEKHVVMSEVTSGTVSKIESTVFTGDGITTGFFMHPSWLGVRAPRDENYIIVKVSDLTHSIEHQNFPSGISRTLDPIQDYYIPESGKAAGWPIIHFYHPPPNGWRISVRNLMVY